jgi:hypothetical protein
MLTAISASSKSGSQTLAYDEYQEFKTANINLLSYHAGSFSCAAYYDRIKTLTGVEMKKGTWIPPADVKSIYEKSLRNMVIFAEQETDFSKEQKDDRNSVVYEIPDLDYDTLANCLAKWCSLDETDVILLKKQKCPGKYISQQTKQDFIQVGFGLGPATALSNWVQEYKNKRGETTPPEKQSSVLLSVPSSPLQISISLNQSPSHSPSLPPSTIRSSSTSSTSSSSSSIFRSSTLHSSSSFSSLERIIEEHTVPKDYKLPPDYTFEDYYIGSFFRLCVKRRVGIWVN